MPYTWNYNYLNPKKRVIVDKRRMEMEMEIQSWCSVPDSFRNGTIRIRSSLFVVSAHVIENVDTLSMSEVFLAIILKIYKKN